MTGVTVEHRSLPLTLYPPLEMSVLELWLSVLPG